MHKRRLIKTLTAKLLFQFQAFSSVEKQQLRNHPALGVFFWVLEQRKNLPKCMMLKAMCWYVVIFHHTNSNIKHACDITSLINATDQSGVTAVVSWHLCRLSMMVLSQFTAIYMCYMCHSVIGHMWADCNVMWKSRVPRLSVVHTGLRMICVLWNPAPLSSGKYLYFFLSEVASFRRLNYFFSTVGDLSGTTLV